MKFLKQQQEHVKAASSVGNVVDMMEEFDGEKFSQIIKDSENQTVCDRIFFNDNFLIYIKSITSYFSAFRIVWKKKFQIICVTYPMNL